MTKKKKLQFYLITIYDKGENYSSILILKCVVWWCGAVGNARHKKIYLKRHWARTHNKQNAFLRIGSFSDCN